MVISDIVLNHELPDTICQHAGLYCACVAGAMVREEYLDAICGAGFGQVEVLAEHVRRLEQVCVDPTTREWAEELDGAASSTTLLATK